MIDLRSDTVTRPCKGMMDAMMSAPVGDDVFVEDPSILELEKYAARMFGKEAGLFCPSGTMTNQIAIRLHTSMGGEVICHEEAHIYQYEAGGIMVNSLASVKLIQGNRGMITVESLEGKINPEDVHKARTQLLCVEDTMNRGGGAVYDTQELRKLSKWAKDKGLKFHNDGARVFNALVENGMDAKEYGSLFDTVSICLSKGLGAPVGSVLVGGKEDMYEARRIRKILGGGMRQAGIIAAGGLYALKNNIERLKIDHARAKTLAEKLSNSFDIEMIYPVETNLVIVELAQGVNPNEYLEKLRKKGALAIGMGGQRVRFTLHLDVSENDFEKLLDIV
jgi:threonine aldolase